MAASPRTARRRRIAAWLVYEVHCKTDDSPQKNLAHPRGVFLAEALIKGRNEYFPNRNEKSTLRRKMRIGAQLRSFFWGLFGTIQRQVADSFKETNESLNECFCSKCL